MHLQMPTRGNAGLGSEDDVNIPLPQDKVNQTVTRESQGLVRKTWLRFNSSAKPA
jgi:hypothetical protein